MAEDKITKRAKKKADRAEKKRKKAGAEDLDFESESTLGGKIVTFFVTLVIIVIWLAILVLLVKMDVGGFGSEVLGPVIKNVPYVNQILPDKALEEESTEDDRYVYETLEQAIDRIKQLEIELAEAQIASDGDAAYIAELEEKAVELERYKLEEASFEELRETWYEEVVFSDEAPDINNYKEYYESIAPANAEALYKQVVEQTLYDEKVEEYVKTYSSMKPKEAAAIFNTMTDDLKLVAEILMSMDAQSRADILGKMDAATAAKITEIMEP
ncbi:MAG: hypothetical protein IKL06_08425 [Lachnospiraceae bacterium]|nr:hypothetical protein [Lachnospiraceae bacterium]